MDSTLFALINRQWSSPLLDPVMKIVTILGRAPVLYLILWLLWMIRADRREKILGWFMVALVLLSDGICTYLWKPMIKRPRPYLQLPNVRLLEPAAHLSAYGFPSNHASNAFALATFVSLAIPRPAVRATLFILAALVGYSRVYIGVHYPLDVFAGALFGVFLGASMFGAAKRCAA